VKRSCAGATPLAPVKWGYKMKMKKGFTLVELMIVVVILGILATIVVPRFLGREEEARRTAAKVQIKNFESALAMFKLDNGFYPATEQGLMALVEEPTTGRIPPNWKQCLPRIPKDLWGNDYVYICPGMDGRDYDIISFGQDGEEGGEGRNGDIESWKLD
jgi:general secretion pathway protein G